MPSRRDGDGAELRCQKDVIRVILGGGVSERLLENDSLCYLSPDFTADSYREEREVTARQPEEETCESDFPSSSISKPSAPPPFPKKKMKKDQVAVTVREQT